VYIWLQTGPQTLHALRTHTRTHVHPHAPARARTHIYTQRKALVDAGPRNGLCRYATWRVLPAQTEHSRGSLLIHGLVGKAACIAWNTYVLGVQPGIQAHTITHSAKNVQGGPDTCSKSRKRTAHQQNYMKRPQLAVPTAQYNSPTDAARACIKINPRSCTQTECQAWAI
jgi:hypothetical protein